MRLIIPGFITSLVLATSAIAAQITVTTTGRIVLLSHQFTDRFAVGQTFTYTFSYEATATPITNHGTIRSIPLQSASLRINATPVWESGSISDPQLSIINGSGTQTDRIAAVATITSPTVPGTGVFAGTFTPASIGMELYAPSTRITNTNVPTSFTLSDWNPYDLVNGSNVYVQFRDRFGALYTVRGEIQTLTSTGGPQPGAPEISEQPRAQLVAAGANVTFSVAASGTGNTYQWRKDGHPLAGATAATLAIANVTAAHAGVYSVVITNAAGSITSANAPLGVTAASNAGRLINLSILTDIASAGDWFTMGYVLGGSGTSGSKQILVRAAGPSLAPLGVTDAVTDPKFETYAGPNKNGENDNWGGSTTLSNAFTAVGAFGFLNAASLDAAALATLSTGDNSVKVSASGTSTGKVIAELYDSTPSANFTATTPRMINVSVLKHLGSGLTAGFVIGGSTAKTVLIRAIGPTIGAAPFNVADAVADPQLTLFSGTNPINSNDNWGGTPTLTAAFRQVGAFDLPATSRDAAVLATLQPGSYTVQVSGANNTTGVVLVEIYEAP